MAAIRGFDFTLHMRLLCQDMVARLDDLQHIDMQRVAIGFTQTRRRSEYGLYAAITPLRFAGGQRYMVRRGVCWGMQQVLDASGREMLYLLRFYLPRFLELPLSDKLLTVMHELWHIGPNFDGDVRRFPGRKYAHGSNKRCFDVQSQQLVDKWLATRPPESVYAFLRLSCNQLLRMYGSIFGERYAVPKLIPLRSADRLHLAGDTLAEHAPAAAARPGQPNSYPAESAPNNH